jgi:hypothetical protein
MDLHSLRDQIRAKNTIMAFFVFGGIAAIAWYLTRPEALTSEDLKNYAEFVAILGAGAYFLYRANTGFFIINLSMSVDCTRVARDDATDYLVVRVQLQKGERGTLVIHDAEVRVEQEGGTSTIVPLTSMQRLSLKHDKIETAYGHREHVKIRWGKRSWKAPFLQMTPGEQCSFACYITVPRREACHVEAVILGKRPAYPAVGQWRATCISTPAPYVG